MTFRFGEGCRSILARWVDVGVRSLVVGGWSLVVRHQIGGDKHGAAQGVLYQEPRTNHQQPLMTDDDRLHYDRLRLQSLARKPFAGLLLLLLTLPACGIVFTAEFKGTEVFREFELASDQMDDGSFLAGTPIEMRLRVNQAYPVPVGISCRYENVEITDDQRQVAFNERALPVFETVLEANPGHEPGDDDGVPDQTFEFEFAAPEAGDYFIACFVVSAPENGIGRGFTTVEP